MCLAIAMFFEARGEGIEGMQAVGDVVINRVEHNKFPDTVCGVVFQGCKFSFNCDGLPEDMDAFKQPVDRKMKDAAIILSEEILNGSRLLPEGVTHYHTTYVSPYWSKHKDFTYVTKVGKHLFYKCKGYC